VDDDISKSLLNWLQFPSLTIAAKLSQKDDFLKRGSVDNTSISLRVIDDDDDDDGRGAALLAVALLLSFSFTVVVEMYEES